MVSLSYANWDDRAVPLLPTTDVGNCQKGALLWARRLFQLQTRPGEGLSCELSGATLQQLTRGKCRHCPWHPVQSIKFKGRNKTDKIPALVELISCEVTQTIKK